MKSPLAALLSACSLVSFASAGGGGGITVRYICAGNTRIQATYTGQHAQIVFNGRVLQMNTALSASGARYVGGGYTWWTRGRTAELYLGETAGQLTSVRQCQESGS